MLKLNALPVLLSMLATCPIAQAGCPTVNGIFESKSTELGGRSIPTRLSLFTEIRDGNYFYQMGSLRDPHPANGKPQAVEHKGQKGFVTFACSGDSLEIRAEPEGGEFYQLAISAEGPDSLVVASNAPAISGTYQKISTTPKPLDASGETL